MSDIDYAFRQARQEAGIEQHPNWAGAVYGACQTKSCVNHRLVAAYVGGWCKKCSTRHRDDARLPIISTVERGEVKVDGPNPSIRWKRRRWVKDMSHTMTPKQKKDFYDAPAGHLG